ncbi:hypothetical protein IWX50DRAFT_49392 [Phyllosticta citricarpa]|uniref:Uncharacterized protein n=1 Tax=Phyllosticta citricarpa TaxID=55181 RepID=A0ABR1MQB1_9PEZI
MARPSEPLRPSSCTPPRRSCTPSIRLLLSASFSSTFLPAYLPTYMRSLGFRRLEGRPTERRRITLLAITICLHFLFWSSLLPFVTMLALFAAHSMDSTVLPSAILTIISTILSICYLILHSFISRRQHVWTEEYTHARRVSIICDVAYRVAASVPIFWFLTTIWNIIIAVRQPICLLTEPGTSSNQEFWRVGSACAAVRSSVAISLIALIASCTLFAIISKVRRPFEASLFGSCSFRRKSKISGLEDGTRVVTQEAPPSRHDSEKSFAHSIAASTPGPSFPSTPHTGDVDFRPGLGIYTPPTRTPPTSGLQRPTSKRSNSANSLFSVSTIIHYDAAGQNGHILPRYGNHCSPLADSAWRAMHPYPPGSPRSMSFHNLHSNGSRTNLVHPMAPSSSSSAIYESPSELPSSLRIRTPSGPPPQVRPSVRPVRPSPALLSLQHRAARQRPLGTRPRTSPAVSGGFYACSSTNASTTSLSSLGSRRCSSSPLSTMVRACEVEVDMLRGKLKNGKKDHESNWVREDSGISVSGSSTDGRCAASSASDGEGKKKSNHRAKRSISAPLPLRLRRSTRPEPPPRAASPPSPQVTPIPRRSSREQRSKARANLSLLPPWDPTSRDLDSAPLCRPETPTPSSRGARELRASLSRLSSKQPPPTPTLHTSSSSSLSSCPESSAAAESETSFLEAVLAAGHVTPLLTSAGFASQRSSIRAALSGRGSSRRSRKSKQQEKTPVPALPENLITPAVVKARSKSAEDLSRAFSGDAGDETQSSRGEAKERKSRARRATATANTDTNTNSRTPYSSSSSATHVNTLIKPDAQIETDLVATGPSERASASASLRSSLAEWMMRERQSHFSHASSAAPCQSREASGASGAPADDLSELALVEKGKEKEEVGVHIFCSGVREASVVGLGVDVGCEKEKEMVRRE